MSLESNDKFAEWIELSFRNGVREEQERIIKLLDETFIYDEPVVIERERLIALIRGENKINQCSCDPCDSKECECYGTRCEHCESQD